METTAPSPTTSPFGSNSVGTAINKASSTAHAAVNSFAGKADDAANRVKPVIERAAAKAHLAVDKAVDAAVPTAHWLAEQGSNLNTAQKKLVENSANYVSAHPLKAVGIALAAGFILSRILR
jgi:ElaB/YqjD/DUF883 family membrane-anchored ribosome-binding protein